MINFVTNFGKKVFQPNEEKTSIENNFQFVKSRKGILKALVQSREIGNVIGVHSPALGEGMFFTAVEDIYDDDKEQIIILKRYDLSGLILHRTNLSLGEFKVICSFDIKYRNPVLN